MAVFARLQNSAFSTWFLGSESIWAYPTVLTLHTLGLAILVGASVVIHLRVLGVGATVPTRDLRVLFRFVWMGFAINLASGLVLFISQAANRTSQPVFGIKLAAIGLALWLGHVVRRRVFDGPDDAPGTTAGTRGLSIASLGFWITAIVAGRLMAYV